MNRGSWIGLLEKLEILKRKVIPHMSEQTQGRQIYHHKPQDLTNFLERRISLWKRIAFQHSYFICGAQEKSAF